MRALLLCCLFVVGGGLFAQTADYTFTESVYFATDSDQLDAAMKAKIADFQQQLSAYADFRISLEAFTDERGDTDYNDKLAAARAASVRAYLETAGIAAADWKVRAFGEQRARQGATDEATLRSDRRVDLVATVTGWQDRASALAALREGLEQTFVTSTDEAFTVTGKRGGRFLIGPNSFVDQDGNPFSGEVTLTLIEAYTFDDILLAGLTTHSGDRLLETGGMFRLTAADPGGNELVLADGKNIPSSVPTDDFNEEMRLFAGLEHEDGELADWALTPRSIFANPARLAASGYRGPYLQRLEVDIDAKMKPWLRANPEPEMEAARKIPGLRPVAVPPDTSMVKIRLSGLQKLFTSRKKQEAMRRRFIDKSKGKYAREVRNRERSIVLRRDNMAFNEGREDRHAVAMASWLNARDAERFRLQEKFDKTNEALRLDYEKKRAAYLAAREAELEASLTGGDLDGKQGDLGRYFFSVSKLGWANCDIFYSEEDPVEVLVNAPETNNQTTVVLIPDGRRAVLAYVPKPGGLWGCKGIPRGNRYTLIAYQIREGKIEYAQQAIAAAGEQPQALSFRPVGIGELKELLGAFGAAK